METKFAKARAAFLSYHSARCSCSPVLRKKFQQKIRFVIGNLKFSKSSGYETYRGCGRCLGLENAPEKQIFVNLQIRRVFCSTCLAFSISRDKLRKMAERNVCISDKNQIKVFLFAPEQNKNNRFHIDFFVYFCVVDQNKSMYTR